METRVLGGQLRLVYQDKAPSEDALWLASFVGPFVLGATPRILDAGCGIGTVGLALCARCPGAQGVGVDIDPDAVALATQNAALNTLNFTAVCGDILQHIPGAPYDIVVCNPPFYSAATHTPATTINRVRAKHLPAGDLGRWLEALAAVLAPRGSMYLVLHMRLQAEIETWATSPKGKKGRLTLVPLQSAANRPAKRLLVKWAAGAEGAEITYAPPVLAYDPALREAVLRWGDTFVGA